MEKRILKVSCGKTGAGNDNYKISLATKWIKKLGVTKENREVYVYQFGDSILIKKAPLEWNQKQCLEFILADINPILEAKGWMEFHDIAKIEIDTFEAYFDDDKDKKNKYWGAIYGCVGDWFEKNSSIILDRINKKTYYCKKNLGIETLEEFQAFLKKDASDD